MSGIDFAKIIDDFYSRNGQLPVPAVGAYALMPKVPKLCPDCQHAAGDAHLSCIATPACTHPNAPTIAKLLAIGAAVWDIWHDDDGEHRVYDEVYYTVKNAMREVS
jgi:hypothetical protein